MMDLAELQHIEREASCSAMLEHMTGLRRWQDICIYVLKALVNVWRSISTVNLIGVAFPYDLKDI